MTTATIGKITGTASLAMITAFAIWSAGCSSNTEQTGVAGGPHVATSAPAAGSCQIDAVKMCQATGSSKAAPEQASMPMTTYGPSNMPDSVEFQIPAGQAIKLMCYYDSQHTSVYRA